jgi:hypothetical protein
MDNDGIEKRNDQQKKSEWIREKKADQAHPSNLAAFLISITQFGMKFNLERSAQRALRIGRCAPFRIVKPQVRLQDRASPLTLELFYFLP